MVLIPVNLRTRCAPRVVAAVVLAAAVVAGVDRSLAESKAVIAAQNAGPVYGPIYSRWTLHPAKEACGEALLMTKGGPVMTPRVGLYESKCSLMTVYGPDGKVLSQQEQCGPPAFAKCS